MTTRNRIQSLNVAAAAMAMLFTTAYPSGGATMSGSPTAPPVAGDDIANHGAVVHTDKWFAGDAYGDPSSAKGQTFTTGGTDVLFKAITYQVASNQKAAPTKTYVIRVGTVVGSTFTEVHSETATQDFEWKVGEHMTWTFDTPVLLSANTTYAVDVGMTQSTSAWQTGIPYLNCTADSYTGGLRYTSGKLGVGDTRMRFHAGHDRIFHLKLEPATGASPKGGNPSPAIPAIPATAVIVTPVGVTATSWWLEQTHPDNLIDGSGLSVNAPTGTHHNESVAATMWYAGVGEGKGGKAPVVADQELVFDLGQAHDLTHALVWNQNQATQSLYLQRGVKTFDILVSPDNKTFTPVGKTVTLEAAGGSPAEKAQVVPLAAAKARYVKFDIRSALSGKANEFVGLSEVRFVAPGAGGVPPPPAPEPPVVATHPPAKPVAPSPPATPSKPAIPATFDAPSAAVQPSLKTMSPGDIRRKVDEDDLEFRFWRNVKVARAIKAAVLDVDAKSGHMHLYLPGGKNYVVAIADYHNADKAYLVDWLSMKAADAKRERAKGGTVTASALPAAPPAVAEAITLRLRTDEDRGEVEAGESKNTYATEHEVTVQVVTRSGAPADMPKGELQLVAYVAHTLKDARMNGAIATAAYDTDSKALKEKKIPPQAIDAFAPGRAVNKVFRFSTQTVKGRGSRKDGKKTLSYRWEHGQTLLGVRARILVGGKLAAESVYPSDLDRLLEKRD